MSGSCNKHRINYMVTFKIIACCRQTTHITGYLVSDLLHFLALVSEMHWTPHLCRINLSGFLFFFICLCKDTEIKWIFLSPCKKNYADKHENAFYCKTYTRGCACQIFSFFMSKATLNCYAVKRNYFPMWTLFIIWQRHFSDLSA